MPNPLARQGPRRRARPHRRAGRGARRPAGHGGAAAGHRRVEDAACSVPGFTPDDLVKEVLTRLAAEPDVTKAVKQVHRRADPLHDRAVGAQRRRLGDGERASGKRTRHVGGLILFDALWGEQNKDDPTKWDSSQRQASWASCGPGAGRSARCSAASARSRSKDDADRRPSRRPGVVDRRHVLPHATRASRQRCTRSSTDTIPAPHTARRSRRSSASCRRRRATTG